jgi:hypothetical protein
MHASVGMMRALNRHVERMFDPSRKDTHGEGPGNGMRRRVVDLGSGSVDPLP